MSNQNNQPHFGKFATAALTAVVSLTAGLSGVAANAQDQTQAPVLMAPPISLPSGTFDAGSDGDAADTAPPVTAPTTPVDKNVFQWQDVPANRQVPITRAVFDKGGYRLTDDQGETIVIPFANQNLYVLRFGQTTGGMYFVNDGTTPTLYIPGNGYLENASAQGARWYPFPQNYTYSAPVYVGPAPSWSEWVGMGWYPDMVYYGGYYGYEPWSFGVAFDAFPGLYFSIGGRPYYGWNAYHTYYSYHPNNRFYVRDGARFGGYGAGRRGSNEFGSRPSHSGGAIRTGGFGGGASGGYAGSAAGASGHAFSGGQRGGNSSYPSNPPRTFRGGQGGSQSSQVGHGGATFGGDHASGGQFSGGHTSSGGFGGNFGGGSNSGGHSSSGTGSRGGDRGFSNGSGGFGGGRGFGGSMGGGGGSHMGGMSGGGGHFGGGGGGHR